MYPTYQPCETVTQGDTTFGAGAAAYAVLQGLQLQARRTVLLGDSESRLTKSTL
jgi:hypothetical protein